ncbi:hypothetical protein ACFX13_040765 [Malus domestica]|uniref:Uncharacterized protein n=1 Tax=Malus baccata TaxID=106549 RepID=A0A540LML3_MALBA|nr:hypothetical protein C1H46_026739 [Malus baccata]
MYPMQKHFQQWWKPVAGAAAGEALSASSNNNQPMLEYADLLKMLEEDPEEFSWFDSAPNAGDAADHYFQLITETLLENCPYPHPL